MAEYNSVNMVAEINIFCGSMCIQMSSFSQVEHAINCVYIALKSGELGNLNFLAVCDRPSQ